MSVKESDRQDEKRKIDDIRIRIMSKTSELRRLEQEISLLKQEEQRHEQLFRNLESKMNPQDQEISKKEAELAKKLQEEEKLKKRLGGFGNGEKNETKSKFRCWCQKRKVFFGKNRKADFGGWR